MTHRPRSASALLLAAALLPACSDGPTGPPPVASLEAEAALVEGTVAQGVPVGIRVLDASGKPIRGVDVALAVTGGGSLALDTVTSAEGGVARTTWTLGIRAGEQRLTATAQGRTVSVLAQAGPGPATTLQALGALAREGAAGSQGAPVAVRSLDAYDNPVPAHAVAFSATAGSLEASSAVTDDAGTASVVVTFPTSAGTFEVRASSSAGSVAFPHTTLPAGPSSLRLIAGDGQAGEVGQTLPVPVEVELADVFGNGVPGRGVAVEVAVGGGSVSLAEAVTDERGRARVVWTLGTGAGAQEVRARFGSLPPVTVGAVALPGPAHAAVALSGDGQDGVPGGELEEPLVVGVTDRYGNGVPGAPVSWSITAGGGALLSAEPQTDAQGHARTRWRLGTAGAQGVAAAVASLGSVAFASTAFGAIAITMDSLAIARHGWPYETSLTAVGAAGAVTWSVAAGALPAGVELAGEGALRGTPAQDGDFPVTLRATDAGGASAQAELSLRVCGAALGLSAGETAVVRYPEACGALLPPAGGATYRVGVMARTYETSGSVTAPVHDGVLLRSRVGTPGSALALRAPIVPPRVWPEDGLSPEDRALAEATERLHHRLREEERLRFPAVPVPALGAPLPQWALVTSGAPLNRTFNVRGTVVNATLRDSSAHVLYYEDDGVTGEGARAEAAEIRAMLEYYDAYGHAVIEEAFGGLGPEGTTRNFKDDSGTVLDLPADDLDRNGRLIVLQIRPSLMLQGAAAYVSSCDRYPTQAHYAAGQYYCSNSNEAEITYFNRPSSDFYVAALVHEAKHISSHGYAVFAGRGYNPSWVEEGTAEIAKEKASRDAAGMADGEEVGYADLYPGGSATRGTYGMTVVHSRARSFLKASPASGIIGNPSPNPNGSTYYGASWLLHRYLADAYAGADEDDFFRGMNTGGTGPAAIEAATGRPFADLLVELMVAVGLEGSGAARDAASTRFRSYDFAEIAAVASGTWPYSQGGGAFRTQDVTLPTYYTAPSFFDFDAAGGEPLRLDALAGEAVDVDAGHDVVLTITRIR